MSNILQIEDFRLRYSVSLGFQDGEQRLTECIERYENEYLLKLFGKELYDSFSGAIPDDYFDPFSLEYKNVLYISKGIKDMLLGFIWCHYCYDNVVLPTSTGNTSISNEAGYLVTSDAVSSMFNQSVDTYTAIQAKCIANNEALFKGKLIRYKSWF